MAICNEDVLLSATRKKQKVMGRGLGALRAHARSVGPRAARASSSEFRELRHECRPEVGLSQKMPGLAKPYFSTDESPLSSSFCTGSPSGRAGAGDHRCFTRGRQRSGFRPRRGPEAL